MSGCGECAHHDSNVGLKERDLGTLARRASRYDAPPPRLLQEIATARAHVDEAKRARAEHDATDHGGVS